MTELPTQDEIVERFEEGKTSGRDPFGFELGEYLLWLDFEHAKKFLKPEATKEFWESPDDEGRALPYEHSKEKLLSVIKGYMPFAWEKANNCRGISAGRSLMHMKAWLWLVGEKKAADSDALLNYTAYGKPQLRAICEHFDINWQQLDDGVWRDSEFDQGTDPQEPAKLWP